MGRLNSRTLKSNDDIEVDVFNGDRLRTINQARRIATARRWNLPEVLSDNPDILPPTINISVQTEREGDTVSATDYDSTGKGDLPL